MKEIIADLESSSIPSTGLWSYYADFMLSNLFESSVLLLENGSERKESDGITEGPLTAYFSDAREKMEFAKWFRPVTFLALTACIQVLTIAVFQQTSLDFYIKVKQSAPLVVFVHSKVSVYLRVLNALHLSWTFSWLVNSAVAALSIQLMLTALAWFNFNKQTSITCALAAGTSVGLMIVNFASVA